MQNVQSIYEGEGEKRETEDEDEEGDTRKKMPNMLDLLFYFEQTNVGLPRSQMVLLNWSIRKLIAESPIENVKYFNVKNFIFSRKETAQFLNCVINFWREILDKFLRNISKLIISHDRFWGKILGSPKNYYVVEADLESEELNNRLEVKR